MLEEKILKMNPLGNIPVYQEGDFILSDSSAICAYIDKLHLNNSLYPSDPKSYAKCLWYEEYADTNLMPAILSVFFNVCLASRFGKEVNYDAVESALEIKIPAIFSYLNSEIGDKKYFSGNQLSLADISINAPFLNFEFAKHTVDSKRYGNLSRYLKNISEEESIKQAIMITRERFYSQNK